jgi:hypothetical protein
MKYYKIIFTLIFIVSFLSCIDEFNPKLDGKTRRLVVEANLTTKLDFHYVYLTFDAPYNSTASIFKDYVADAKVKMIDNLGNEYLFFDDPTQNNMIKTSFGYNYRSVNKFKAEVGRTYQLFVETFDKKTYVSAPEKVLPVAPVENVKIDFEEINPASYVKGKFKVSVNVKDRAKENNYYKWDWYNVKQINWCREYTIGSAAGTLSYVDPCCETCYQISPCIDCIELAQDKLIDGNVFNKPITTIPFDDNTNYYLVVNQYSISENAYKFWNAVKEQSKNSGGLFDAIPKSIKGNFKNAKDPKEEVLGYFTVSDVHEEIIIIDRNLKSPKPYIIELYQPPWWVRTQKCFPCVESYNRTKIKPKGWK